MADKGYHYEKPEEDGSIKWCPMNDIDGKITGRFIMNLEEWFDENPEERKRLGWIKHITHNPDEYGWDRQTQYYVISQKQIDEYTIEDEYHFLPKSEEMLLLEEMAECINQPLVRGQSIGGFTFF